MKEKLFSHVDYDGIMCGVLGQLAFGKENIDIEYCNYDDIDEKVTKFLLNEDLSQYDNIFITDISVNDDTALLIESFVKNENLKIQLIDHHPTALELNKYDWCDVLVENRLIWENGKEERIHKMCGTYLFYLFLKNNIGIWNWFDIKTVNEIKNLNYLIEITRQYDTWEWMTFYHDNLPKQFNNLLYILGRDKFIENIIAKVHSIVDFTDTDKLLLNLEQDKIKMYIDKKSKDMIRDIITIKDRVYSIGIVFAEQYISELGNVLAKENEDVDFIIIITNCKTVSLRCVKENIDVRLIAKEYGGGGHPKASGFEINNDIRQKIIDKILRY